MKRQLPLLRAHCERGPRPCPYLSCRHHLLIEVTARGEVRTPHRAQLRALLKGTLSSRVPTCSLDVADLGGISHEKVATHIGANSRQLVLQIERGAYDRLKDALR